MSLFDAVSFGASVPWRIDGTSIALCHRGGNQYHHHPAPHVWHVHASPLGGWPLDASLHTLVILSIAHLPRSLCRALAFGDAEAWCTGGGQRGRGDWPCVHLSRDTCAVLGSFQTVGRLRALNLAFSNRLG